MKTLTSRQLQRAPARARRQANEQPIFITERGIPAYVLLSYDDYLQLPGVKAGLAPTA